MHIWQFVLTWEFSWLFLLLGLCTFFLFYVLHKSNYFTNIHSFIDVLQIFTMFPISLEFSSICWAILIWLMNEIFWNCRLRGTDQLVLFDNIWCSCNHGCHSFHRSLVQKIWWMFMNWSSRLNWPNAIKIINIQPTQTLQLQINKCTACFFFFHLDVIKKIDYCIHKCMWILFVRYFQSHMVLSKLLLSNFITKMHIFTLKSRDNMLLFWFNLCEIGFFSAFPFETLWILLMEPS